MFPSPQVRIQATDSGISPKSAVVYLYVTIIRNFSPPQWERQQYAATIFETQQVLLPIVTVKANDFDAKVSLCIFMHYL